MNTTTTKKTNRYPARCNACGGNVPAGEGILAGRMVGGGRRWLVRHDAPECTPPAAMPVLRAPAARAAAAPAYRFAGMTWPQVDEANEFFDGETEIRAAARAEWERRSGMFCRRHGDSFAHGDTTCWECEAEAEEARRDRLDG